MSIVRMDSLKATGEIPERMAPRVQSAASRTSVDASQARASLARCRASARLEHRDACIRVRAQVPNADGALKPGTFAHPSSRRRSSSRSSPFPMQRDAAPLRRHRAFALADDHLAMHELKTGDPHGAT